MMPIPIGSYVMVMNKKEHLLLLHEALSQGVYIGSGLSATKLYNYPLYVHTETGKATNAISALRDRRCLKFGDLDQVEFEL